MRFRLDKAAKAARLESRAAAREAASAKVTELREWRQQRADAARKRAKAEREARLRVADRGVNRVPEQYQDLYVTVERHEVGKREGAAPIDSTLGVWNGPRGPYVANHDQRRRAGQRRKGRRPRRREMPGAVARRIERNRKAWLS